MTEDELVYRRDGANPQSWSTYSDEHLAFLLHRVTGWLLLGWVVLHLVVPVTNGPAAIWYPTSDLFVTALLSVLLFHGFNGLRLIVAELGYGAASTRRLFQATLLVCLLLVVVLGWSL
jgi:succinate dehydrogenase/fumarate reductase cytochrome b subunit